MRQRKGPVISPRLWYSFWGAVIFWDVLFRAQQGVAISFLEDVWTRNLLNVFVAPVRAVEYVMATFAVGILRIFVTVATLCLLAGVLYHFSLFTLSWWLIPFMANLLLFGWCLGMVSTALILRWGQAAEALAWAVPFMIQPLACVFYPLSILPAWAQPFALALPCTHVFEGMRTILAGHPPSWEGFAAATGLNILYMIGTGWYFGWTLSQTKKRGLLVKVATH
jgi:ABC-2 type transport system permease protein